jgi:hypothetical protein
VSTIGDRSPCSAGVGAAGILSQCLERWSQAVESGSPAAASEAGGACSAALRAPMPDADDGDGVAFEAVAVDVVPPAKERCSSRGRPACIGGRGGGDRGDGRRRSGSGGWPRRRWSWRRPGSRSGAGGGLAFRRRARGRWSWTRCPPTDRKYEPPRASRCARNRTIAGAGSVVNTEHRG